jgi:hypothetical protein
MAAELRLWFVRRDSREEAMLNVECGTCMVRMVRAAMSSISMNIP